MVNRISPPLTDFKPTALFRNRRGLEEGREKRNYPQRVNLSIGF